MCGRFTRKYTWGEIHELYRLTVPAAIPNFRPLYNVCPTDPADTVVLNDGQHELVEMRWGLIPYWWSKPLLTWMLGIARFKACTAATVYAPEEGLDEQVAGAIEPADDLVAILQREDSPRHQLSEHVRGYAVWQRNNIKNRNMNRPGQ